jgi:hypothetical protein
MPRGYLWRDQSDTIVLTNKYVDSFWKNFLKEKKVPHSSTHQYVGGPQAFCEALLPTWEKSGLSIHPVNKESVPSFFNSSPLLSKDFNIYKTDDISFNNETLLQRMAAPLLK